MGRADVYGYSGLHYLRRVAAYLDAGLPPPPPGDEKSASDPVLKAYYANATGAQPGLLPQRLGRPLRFAHAFNHLIVHSDADGFYLPLDFPRVLLATDDQFLSGDMLGSVPRLLAELERLAERLAIPPDLHAQSDALWEAADAQGQGPELWQRYGVETYSCVVLREACRHSLETGAAIVFC